MNGIELLIKIKQNKIKDKSIITVEKDNKYLFMMLYIDSEIKWLKNTFKLSMLIDDNYTFNIMGEVNDVLEAVNKIVDNIPDIKTELIQEIKDTIKSINI